MTRNKQTIKVVTVSEERRRRWSVQEKAALVKETYERGMSVSLVARKHGISVNQLFNWRKLEREDALVAELAAMRAQIAQLQRMFGKKTMEAEILREAVEVARENLWFPSFLQAGLYDVRRFASIYPASVEICSAPR